MNFAQQQNDPRRRLIGFGAVLLFHLLVVYALVSGLAKKVVDVVRAPIETKVIEEIKKPPPPPEVVVPPPPKLEAPPPPFIPPPEIQIATPPPPPFETRTAAKFRRVLILEGGVGGVSRNNEKFPRRRGKGVKSESASRRLWKCKWRRRRRRGPLGYFALALNLERLDPSDSFFARRVTAAR